MLSLNRAAWSLRMLLSGVSNQATICSEPPTCRIETFASSDILPSATFAPSHHCRAWNGLVKERGHVLRPALGIFKVRYSAQRMTPHFEQKVHLSWPSDPG